MQDVAFPAEPFAPKVARIIEERWDKMIAPGVHFGITTKGITE